MSGKVTRESSCNALPLAYHNSSHYVSNDSKISNGTIMHKIIADKFSFVLVLLCCFCAFLANIVSSANKLSSKQCSWKLAAIIGPVEHRKCPFPLINSILRISISIYLILFLIILICVLHTYQHRACYSRVSLSQCIACTITILSLTRYLCLISIIMDCYSVYIAYKITCYQFIFTLSIQCMLYLRSPIESNINLLTEEMGKLQSIQV